MALGFRSSAFLAGLGPVARAVGLARGRRRRGPAPGVHVGPDPMETTRMTDDALASLEQRLNRYEPRDVREALHAVRVMPRKIAGASGPLDFGSIGPGVLVYRDEAGAVRIRVTVAEMTGATYDELELPDDEVRTMATAIVDRLVRTGAPRS